jgi:hypothetical protein
MDEHTLPEDLSQENKNWLRIMMALQKGMLDMQEDTNKRMADVGKLMEVTNKLLIEVTQTMREVLDYVKPDECNLDPCGYTEHGDVVYPEKKDG